MTAEDRDSLARQEQRGKRHLNWIAMVEELRQQEHAYCVRYQQKRDAYLGTPHRADEDAHERMITHYQTLAEYSVPMFL